MRETSAPDATIAFRTSGQSGTPVTWMRTPQQIVAEALLVAACLPERVDRVITYAPPLHLYGRIFSDALPAYLGVPVEDAWHEPLRPPHLPPDERVLIVCLPATWRLLRDLVPRLGTPPAVTAVHGTGRLTPEGAAVVESLAETPFGGFEIFGSTETGAIAHRPLGGGEWTLFRDVEMLTKHGAEHSQQRLRVRSPRLARSPGGPREPDGHTLDDLVVPTGERTFLVTGRASRMLKVNGRRVHLERVEDTLCAAFPGIDVACVPWDDPVRGEHYSIVCATAAVTLPDADIDRVIRAMDPLPALPRTIHRVTSIPRGDTGKVRLDRLATHLGARPGVTSAMGATRSELGS